MKKIYTFLLFVCFITAFSYVIHISVAAEKKPEITRFADIEWGYLNPARGDAGPRAATLWGDRTANVASGFLVKFKDGFSSPPHIHNVTYRGVVISGLVHNDDPKAENMWLPAGSFWTQPAGESHITAAIGKNNIAYIEIDEGPYLVKPAEQAFDNGERPVNVDKSNLVWLDAKDVKWINDSNNNAEVAFLWGSPKEKALNGSFLKLPAGFSGKILAHGAIFRAVVIQGQANVQSVELESGSYFGSSGVTEYSVSTKDETIIYIRTDGKFKPIQG